MRGYRRSSSAIALFITGLAPSLAAAADDREVSPQFYFPNAGPRGEIDYKPGDYLVQLPIVWAAAARIENPVSLVVGDRHQNLAAGTVLPIMEFLPSQESNSKVIAYCTERKSAERSLDGFMGTMFSGSLTRKIVRDASDVQFCLSDADGDGQFEQWRLVGAGWNERAIVHTIAPVGYSEVRDAPVSSRDEVRLKLEAVETSHIRLVLEVVQQGRVRTFDTVSAGGFTAQRKNRIDVNGRLPTVSTIFGMDFEVIALDVRKRVRVRWPEAVDRVRRLILPQDVTFIYRFAPY